MDKTSSINIDYLIKKSVDSFLMAIEVYNKPTIAYRLEGCLFFLHNAWELSLKAKLVKDDISIYYKDSKDSLSLRDAAKKLMTNDKDPVRRNLDVIISYRNMATHLFIPEYDYILLPFISFNVESYANKMMEYHSVNINDYITSDFLSLFSAKSSVDTTNLLSKYGADIESFFNESENKLIEAIDNAGENSIATKVEINLVRVNQKSKADFSIYQTRKDSEGIQVQYINRNLDPNSTHTLSHKKVQKEINHYLITNSIPFTPIREQRILEDGSLTDLFTTHSLDLILREYDLKSNLDYCYGFDLGNTKNYKYHSKIITYIISLIQSDKDIAIKIKQKKR